MDTKRAGHLLKKINRFFDDFADDGGQPSALERDLLKQYVRRFYEELSSPAGIEPAHTVGRAESATAPEPVRAPKAKPAVQIPTPAFAFAPEPAPEPRLIEVPAEVEADVQRIERSSAQVAEIPEPVTAPARGGLGVPVTVPSEPLESPFAPEPEELSGPLKELFAVQQGSDLIEKLAGSPVRDLTRAMAINERLVALSTLFGGNKSELDQALQHLNDLDSYEDAVSYLGGGIAKKYDWTEEEKSGAARDFIKLVRRRYA